MEPRLAIGRRQGAAEGMARPVASCGSSGLRIHLMSRIIGDAPAPLGDRQLPLSSARV
jgi:hypothetical protein